MRRLWQQKDEVRSTDSTSLFLGNAMSALGGVTVILMFVNQTSDAWFMINSRPFARRLQMRMIGPAAVVEAKYHLEVNYFYGFEGSERSSNWPRRREFSLSERSSRVCEGTNNGDLLDSPSRWLPILGLDWEDMNMSGVSKFPCRSDSAVASDHEKSSFRNIIPPARRLIHTSPIAMTENTLVRDRDVILRYDVGCADLNAREMTVECPPGYALCPQSDWRPCADNEDKLEPACCVVGSATGQPLHNVSQTPTYVQASSYTGWQTLGMRAIKDETSGSEEIRFPHQDRTKWCQVRQERCSVLSEFFSLGQGFHRHLLLSTLLAVAGLAMTSGRFRIPWLSDVGGCFFAASGVLMLYASITYRDGIGQALAKSMTPIDVWGRPFVHPFKDYPGSILAGPSDDVNAEWLWDTRQAMVNYAVYDPSNPKGYSLLWAGHLSIICGCLALVVAVACGEMFFARKGASPILSLFQLLFMPVVWAFRLVQHLIDRHLLNHSAADPYWYHRMYPRAFTVGRWLPTPLDQLWDWVLMLPVHIVRAMWDCASLQTISSPQEKQVLEEQGITHKKMQSLMSSRRSHFAVTFALSFILLMVNFARVMHVLPNASLQLRPTLTHAATYPEHRCNYYNGNCRTQVGDLTSLTAYVVGFLHRIYAVRMLHVGHVVMKRTIGEWLAGFAAMCCALGALVHWTDTKVSRRLNLLGWSLLIFVPVVTSFISEAPSMREETKQAMIYDGAEIWGELFTFFNTPCDQIIGNSTALASKGNDICEWVGDYPVQASLPPELKSGCADYRTRYAASYQAGDNLANMEANTSSVCHWARAYIKDDGPKTYSDTVAFIEAKADIVLDLLFSSTVQVTSMNKAFHALPHILAIIPGMMQALLMAKNLVPSLPASHLAMLLPCGFVALSWAFFQLLYQIWTGPLFYLSVLALALGPLLYGVLASMSNLRQPMDDKQAFAVTTGIWWYVFIFTRLLPSLGILIYFMFTVSQSRSIGASLAYWSWSSMYHDNLPAALLGFFATLGLVYVSTLQAVMDAFILEVVESHVASHAPLVLAMSRSRNDAEHLQSRLQTNIDLDQIVSGTYVCGGKKVERSPEGWAKQTKIWVWDMQSKDLETLDEFALHLKSQDRIPRILKQARKVYFDIMVQRLKDPEVVEAGESMLDPGEFNPGDVICIDGRRGLVQGAGASGTIAVRWMDTDEEAEIDMPGVIDVENDRGSLISLERSSRPSRLSTELPSLADVAGVPLAQSFDVRQQRSRSEGLDAQVAGVPLAQSHDGGSRQGLRAQGSSFATTAGAHTDSMDDVRHRRTSLQHANTFNDSIGVGGQAPLPARLRQSRTFAHSTGEDQHTEPTIVRMNTFQSGNAGDASWTVEAQYDQLGHEQLMDEGVPQNLYQGSLAYPSAAAPPPALAARGSARGDPQWPQPTGTEVSLTNISVQAHPEQRGALAHPLQAYPEQPSSPAHPLLPEQPAPPGRSQRGRTQEEADARARRPTESEATDEEWNDEGAGISSDGSAKAARQAGAPPPGASPPGRGLSPPPGHGASPGPLGRGGSRGGSRGGGSRGGSTAGSFG